MKVITLLAQGTKNTAFSDVLFNVGFTDKMLDAIGLTCICNSFALCYFSVNVHAFR